MGNALSRIIASLFGEKEVRILILGLDNGMRCATFPLLRLTIWSHWLPLVLLVSSLMAN